MIHNPPCRDWRDHLAIAVEAEDVEHRLPDFLDRFDAEREAEERAAVREQATAETELELASDWGDR